VKNKFLFFKIISFFFFFKLFFLTLVALDILLPRISKIFNPAYKVSQKIIIDRRIEDNQFLIKTKNKKWPYIYTQDYNLYPLNKFVQKNHIIPLGTLPYQDLILCSEGYGIIEIKTDRFGFRNEDRIWESRDVETVVIGDSFTDGQCVQEQFSFVGILNDKGIKTLRLSQGGYSSIHYAFLTKIFVPSIKPKNLVIVFHENDNDVIDLNEYHYEFFFKKNINDYIDFKEGVPYPSKQIKSFNSDIFNFISEDYEKNKNVSSDKLRISFSKLKKYFLLSNTKKNILLLTNSKKLIGSNYLAIDTAINMCEKIKCNAYFILVRSSSFWDPNPAFYYDNYKIALEVYLKKYEKKLITFDNIYDYQNKKEYFAPKGPHPSKKFNQIIANKIYDTIIGELHKNN
jgi:hypothetical protein